ncbi:hypothetical protein QFZ22_000159 [Streptomyces canus]|uniref:Transposase IS204/IS1001/IS1096/IS1165 DDE domain-containing protein n=1 Tax=Streptomyces canus TaxID=58343 RepID=A0AAW8F262_9ACTN|nr:hypothetical protein [Streptomyces canus]
MARSGFCGPSLQQGQDQRKDNKGTSEGGCRRGEAFRPAQSGSQWGAGGGDGGAGDVVRDVSEDEGEGSGNNRDRDPRSLGVPVPDLKLINGAKGVVKELCGRAAARLTRLLAVPVSSATALRVLRGIPPPTLRIPRVIGVDDFALRRRHRYATIIIDAETGERVDVLPHREAATLEALLRGQKGIEVVCRDGSATYAEAIRRALPDAVQVSDRWHLWRNLCDKVLAEVRAHAPCWATVNLPRPGGVREQTTRERRHKVHSLLDSGVGLLDCSRRLNLALNTVKRYARIPEPPADRIAPATGPPLSTPTATTCAGAGPTTRPFPLRTSCTRSGNWAIAAVPTCWSAASIRAAQKATAP